MRNAWAVTEESLKRIQHATTAKGATLCVIGIDNAFTVDSDVKEKHITDPRVDVRFPLETLRLVAERLALKYFDAQPALLARQIELQHKIYDEPPGNLAGHLKPEGEQILAEVAQQCVH